MANRLLTVEEVAHHFTTTLNAYAEELPEDLRDEFKVQCLSWIGGVMFQGAVKVPKDALGNV